MDPAGAAAQDEEWNRISRLRKELKGVSLGEFTVEELGAVMKLFSLAYNGAGTLRPHKTDFELLEKKVKALKNKK
jgi:hypothetical protein